MEGEGDQVKRALPYDVVKEVKELRSRVLELEDQLGTVKDVVRTLGKAMEDVFLVLAKDKLAEAERANKMIGVPMANTERSATEILASI